MSYKITFKNSVRKDLKKLSKPDATRILKKLENDLTENADAYPVLRGKFAGLRKYRVGTYRVVYSIRENTVVILRIRHRRDVYR